MSQKFKDRFLSMEKDKNEMKTPTLVGLFMITILMPATMYFMAVSSKGDDLRKKKMRARQSAQFDRDMRVPKGLFGWDRSDVEMPVDLFEERVPALKELRTAFDEVKIPISDKGRHKFHELQESQMRTDYLKRASSQYHEWLVSEEGYGTVTQELDRVRNEREKRKKDGRMAATYEKTDNIPFWSRGRFDTGVRKADDVRR